MKKKLIKLLADMKAAQKELESCGISLSCENLHIQVMEKKTINNLLKLELDERKISSDGVFLGFYKIKETGLEGSQVIVLNDGDTRKEYEEFLAWKENQKK